MENKQYILYVAAVVVVLVGTQKNSGIDQRIVGTVFVAAAFVHTVVVGVVGGLLVPSGTERRTASRMNFFFFYVF